MARFERKVSQGLFLLGLAALTAALIPACGGGGDSDAAAPQAANNIKVYVYTVTSPLSIPLGQTSLGLLHSFSFTPASLNHEILSVTATGTMAVTDGADLKVEVWDPSNRTIFAGAAYHSMQNVLQNYAIVTSRPLAGAASSLPPPTYPATTYQVRLLGSNSSPPSAAVDVTVSYRIVVAENVDLITSSIP